MRRSHKAITTLTTKRTSTTTKEPITMTVDPEEISEAATPTEETLNISVQANETNSTPINPVTTTTTALLASDELTRSTITKVPSLSETMPSDSAVNESTEQMTLNSDDVSLFTKSISVLATSATILSVSIITSNPTEQTISSIDSRQSATSISDTNSRLSTDDTDSTSTNFTGNTNLLDLYTAYQTTS